MTFFYHGRYDTAQPSLPPLLLSCTHTAQHAEEITLFLTGLKMSGKADTGNDPQKICRNVAQTKTKVWLIGSTI